MPNQTETTWTSILDPIVKSLAAAGIKEIPIPDKEPAALQGSLGQTFVLPIKNGHGRQSSVRETTYFVKITGLATITAPDGGTWRLVVNDTVAHKTILDQKNVTAGVAIPFAYRTGMHAQIQVDATWDRKEDTTLKVMIDAKY